MQKVVYIIPGSGESPREKCYQNIARWFSAQGIQPQLVSIHWNHRVMSDYIKEFLKKYKQTHRRGDEIYLFGFSFGAMIVFISFAKIRPKTIILCSLSPYFKEDISNIPEKWMKGKNKNETLELQRGVKNLKNFSFRTFVRKVNSKTFILCGKEEHKLCINRSRNAKKEIKNSKLILIPETKHRLSNKKYLEKVREVIQKL